MNNQHPPTAECSLITLHYRRERHLKNLLRGLQMGKTRPKECVVVCIGERVDLSTFDDLNLHVVQIDHVDGDPLPLARARNAGAEAAGCEHLIFLDVDCIPHPEFIDDMRNCLTRYATDFANGLVMASPRYLNEPVDSNFTSEDLMADSQLHPHRPEVEGICREECYELFWSLCFGLTKSTFEIIGGFCEDYSGYGGEDTDFALEAKRNNVPFYLCDAVVFHQQHAFYRPALNHFNDIVKNARTFHRRWNRWAMENQLQAFSEAGYLNWSEGERPETLKVLKQPSAEAVEQAVVTDEPFA